MDGHLKTDISEPNVVFAGLQTETHGMVLWAKLDQDAHRIGFTLDSTLQAKYPNGPTEEQAKEEVALALLPFKLEIERLDWFIYYA